MQIYLKGKEEVKGRQFLEVNSDISKEKGGRLKEKKKKHRSLKLYSQRSKSQFLIFCVIITRCGKLKKCKKV